MKHVTFRLLKVKQFTRFDPKLEILASCKSYTPFISSEAKNLLISSALYIGVQKAQLTVHHPPSWTLRAVSNLDK
jgi:hypothetical protein